MIKISNHRIYNLIRLGYPLSLIFFVLTAMMSCRQADNKNIIISWTGKQATSISIPKDLLKDPAIDSIEKQVETRLQNTPVAMLGEYQDEHHAIIFKPVVSFLRGSRYEVFFRNELIGHVDIPLDSTATSPKLLAIYPTSDTVPENLLKLYFQFSQPMREGQALQHIVLLSASNDTIPGIFLDLQPELWNKERTVLTLWLDPGRIKRDLIPNQKMGNPLHKGQRYKLVVTTAWKDTEGIPLQHNYTRNFIVSYRDSLSPQPKSWSVILPTAGTNQPLQVISKEPLDYFLLLETVSVVSENGALIDGKIRIAEKETGFLFVPAKQWSAGRYKLLVAARLEDLAGNNLGRLFDRDMLAPKIVIDKDAGEKEFVISER